MRENKNKESGKGYFGKKMIMTGAIAIGIAAILVLATNLSAAPSPTATTSTIEVSQLTHLTTNSEYDRNPSICYNGSDYWLFYTKGDDTSTSGVRGVSYDPDSDTYVVYYKIASTLTGLEGASETKLTLSETTRPTGFDQRVVSATYFKGNVYAFVSSGQSGTNRGLYYYRYNGVWSGPTILINDATARGGHVNVVSDSNYVYIVWESSGGSSDCYTWDGTTLSSKIDISNDNQPKVTLMGSTLYVVSIEDGTGDIEVYSAAAGANPSFSSHSTAISGAGFFDPCIFNDGTDLYVVTAPYVGGNDQQYLVQSYYSSGSWSTARNVSLGGYGGTYWWDYWPIGYYDGSDLYVFFTTESNSPSYSDAEIAYIEMDWDLDNDHYFYIQNAIDEANSGTTINMAAGTHAEGPQLHVDKDLTVSGQGCGVTVLNPTSNTGTSGDARGWWLVDDGVEFNLDNMTLDGFGYKIYQGIRHKGFGTIDHVCFTEIKYEPSGPTYGGVAIAAFGSTGSVNTTNCVFTEIGRVGILQWINGTIKGNTYTGKGDGDWLDYFVDTELSAVTVEDNIVSECMGVASSDGSTSAGILVTTYYGLGAKVTLTDNTIHDCTDGVAVGYNDSDTSILTLTENNIYNNDYGINMIGHSYADIDGTNTFSGNTYDYYHMTHIVGTTDYWGNIKDAYDNITSTTIYIYPGTYTETITISNGHTDLLIHGDDSERPVIDGGIYFTNTDLINGITIYNLYLKGEAASSTIIRANSNGVKNDFIMDNCIVNGENVSGRNGMTGNQFGENLTFTNNEFKDVYGWALMDIDSSSDYGVGHWGANGLPFTTVTWADNYVHHCDGSIALRGNDTYKTTFVAIYNNTWEDIGGHDASDQHWAAIEINHAVAADVYDNTIDDVALGMWSEGQGIQLWDVDTLDIYNNTITNCEQAGIFVFGGSLGGNYGGPWAVPEGSIYYNNFDGNGYGVEMESTCTGGPLDAECNWWGCSFGPTHTSNPIGSGDNVSDNIDFIPWLHAPYPDGDCIGMPGVDYDWNYWDNPPHMWSIPDGNVGIGTDSPETKLHVNGSVRVQGDAKSYLFFIDANTDKIGIGTNNPSDPLHVYTTTHSKGIKVEAYNTGGNNPQMFYLTCNNPSQSSDPQFAIENAKVGYKWTFRTYTPTEGFAISKIGTGGTELQITSANGASYTDVGLNLGNGRLFVDQSSGYVGINTTNPSCQLDVEGTVEANAFNTGDIFFQKDGKQLWRMFEDENGLYVERLETGEIYTLVSKDTQNNAMALKHLGNSIPGIQVILTLSIIGAIGLAFILLRKRKPNL